MAESLFQCGNPECRKTIDDEDMMYCPEYKTFYHTGDCTVKGIAYKVMESEGSRLGPVAFLVSRKRALEIAHPGSR